MKFNRFQKLAFLTILATYFLIMVGGLVRATDSGLGCPDWPKCYDRWIPPTSIDQVPLEIQHQFNLAKAWTEYINRLIGVMIGFLIMATFVFAIIDYRDKFRVWFFSLLAWLGVGFEGWLGAKVVKSELHPWMVTVHLVVALIIVILLIYVWIQASDFKFKLTVNSKFYGFLVFCLLLLLLQVGLGAWLRGELDALRQHNPQITRENVIGFSKLFIWHRSFSWLVFLANLALWIFGRKIVKPIPLLQKMMNGGLALLLIQLLSGIGLAYLELPRVLQVVHLIVSSLWVGILASLLLILSQSRQNCRAFLPS